MWLTRVASGQVDSSHRYWHKVAPSAVLVWIRCCEDTRAWSLSINVYVDYVECPLVESQRRGIPSGGISRDVPKGESLLRAIVSSSYRSIHEGLSPPQGRSGLVKTSSLEAASEVAAGVEYVGTGRNVDGVSLPRVGARNLNTSVRIPRPQTLATSDTYDRQIPDTRLLRLLKSGREHQEPQSPHVRLNKYESIHALHDPACRSGVRPTSMRAERVHCSLLCQASEFNFQLIK
ncbi:hypothetical protein KC354_g75 [Hortaea werneckii]|nr:hypothetical protein KC354_g75 [Hortaea werneckii]